MLLKICLAVFTLNFLFSRNIFNKSMGYVMYANEVCERWRWRFHLKSFLFACLESAGFGLCVRGQKRWTWLIYEDDEQSFASASDPRKINESLMDDQGPKSSEAF